MKREVYTMNENSTHKNDDFAKKTPKTPPKQKSVDTSIHVFFLGLKIEPWTKHRILLFNKNLKSTLNWKKRKILEEINYNFLENCILKKKQISLIISPL